MRRGHVVGFLVIAAGIAWAAASLAQKPVAFWGDSLTVHRFPFAFALLTQRRVFDGGVGGETSTQILRRFERDTGRRGWITIFWMGRNNYHEPERVEADIARAVAQLGHQRYLVLSVINGDFPSEWKDSADYKIIARINGELARAYLDHFVDVRRYLVEQGSGADFAHDIPPHTLRFDPVHPNTFGKIRLAWLVRQRVRQFGW